MTLHSVKNKLVACDSKHKILIELTNNSKQMPLQPDMSSLFIGNIQETVFNYICVHLEMSRKRRQLGRNCTRYHHALIQTAFFRQSPPALLCWQLQHSCVCWYPSLLCVSLLTWSPKWLLFTIVIFYAVTRIWIDYVKYDVWKSK